VLSLLNGALGPLVSAAGPERQALIALSLDVNTRYTSIREVPTKSLETLRTLIQIAHFFDLSNANRLGEGTFQDLHTPHARTQILTTAHARTYAQRCSGWKWLGSCRSTR
jgi:hypothetical protein